MKKHRKRKNKQIKGQGELKMSLYEVNQAMISQLPAYDSSQLNELEDKLNDWAASFLSAGRRYFMLLCNDYHYYTIFNKVEHQFAEFPDLGQAVIEGCLKSCSWTVHSDENCEDHYEIWIKVHDNTYCFLLFPYDEGVINYG